MKHPELSPKHELEREDRLSAARRFGRQGIKMSVAEFITSHHSAKQNYARRYKASYAPSVRFQELSDIDEYTIDDLELLEAFHGDSVRDRGQRVVIPSTSEAERRLDAEDSIWDED